ncbi:hypothetical protein ASPBRDRAFT_43885 [Aspergillus brasiliensis CBS 101740]|uniref:Uncharacterized protein n=1 Tax=Aspergillus brasiliensis (strain CBS 101740 / IMI 381727 / IBT 21946) TaxID=767769 RepID=A0A1L9UH31_ASPBC|nr:hypothetical protein ASPBRDRAFT_43885 [Aspergillus brasiliensis CBS 101740]
MPFRDSFMILIVEVPLPRCPGGGVAGSGLVQAFGTVVASLLQTGQGCTAKVQLTSHSVVVVTISIRPSYPKSTLPPLPRDRASMSNLTRFRVHSCPYWIGYAG